MACKKGCSNSQTKWALLGSACVVLVLAIGLSLGFVLQQRRRPGRAPLSCHLLGFPIDRSDGRLSRPASPLRLYPQQQLSLTPPPGLLPSAQNSLPFGGSCGHLRLLRV